MNARFSPLAGLVRVTPPPMHRGALDRLADLGFAVLAHPGVPALETLLGASALGDWRLHEEVVPAWEPGSDDVAAFRERTHLATRRALIRLVRAVEAELRDARPVVVCAPPGTATGQVVAVAALCRALDLEPDALPVSFAIPVGHGGAVAWCRSLP